MRTSYSGSKHRRMVFNREWVVPFGAIPSRGCSVPLYQLPNNIIIIIPTINKNKFEDQNIYPILIIDPN